MSLYLIRFLFLLKNLIIIRFTYSNLINLPINFLIFYILIFSKIHFLFEYNKIKILKKIKLLYYTQYDINLLTILFMLL